MESPLMASWRFSRHALHVTLLASRSRDTIAPLATTDKRLDRFRWNLIGNNFGVYPRCLQSENKFGRQGAESRPVEQKNYRKTCNFRLFSSISCYRLKISGENRRKMIETHATHGLLTIYAKKIHQGALWGQKTLYFGQNFSFWRFLRLVL